VKWKSIALAATLVGVLATPSAASAATSQVESAYLLPRNCPQGTFCTWAGWNHPPEGPTETPSLVTSGEWTGQVPAFNYYNHTSRKAEITWSWVYLGQPVTGKLCVPPGSGADLYVPMYATKVSWHTTTC
jgi:hypothetical protein